MMGERGVNEKGKSGKGDTPKSEACDNIQNLRKRGQVMHTRARRDGAIHSSEATTE
jgi:hypothetical protein